MSNKPVGEIVMSENNKRCQDAQISLTDFLGAFYPNPHEKIFLRTFKAKGTPDTLEIWPAKYSTTRTQLSANSNFKAMLDRANVTRGIYFVVNAGGNEDSEITRYNAFFVESDTKTRDEQNEALDNAPILTSIRVTTKKSVHAYWLIEGDCTEQDWREIQQRLISYFDGDKTIKNPSRVMRLPFFNHVTYNSKNDFAYAPVRVDQFDSGRRYTVGRMKSVFPESKQQFKSQIAAPVGWQEIPDCDDRNAELKRRIMQTGKQNNRGIYETKGICHNGISQTGLMFNPATGAVKCLKGCTHQQVLAAFGLEAQVSYSPITGRKLLTA